MASKIYAYIFAVLCSVIWGLSFLLSKIALEELNTIQVLAARWTIALTLFAILIVFKVIKVDLKGKPIKYLLLLGLLQPCISQFFEVKGIDMTTTSESAIIYAMIPIIVAILSIFMLKHKLKPLSALGIALSFAGIVISTVLSDSFSVDGKIAGYFVLLGAVVVAALFTIKSEQLADTYTSVERTIGMAIMGTLYFNIVNMASGNGSEVFQIMFQMPRIGLAVLFLGGLASFGAYIMFNYALSHIPAWQASAINVNLMTLTGVAAGIIFQGDSFGWYTVVGMVMIVAGVIIANLPDKEK